MQMTRHDRTWHDAVTLLYAFVTACFMSNTSYPFTITCTCTSTKPTAHIVLLKPKKKAEGNGFRYSISYDDHLMCKFILQWGKTQVRYMHLFMLRWGMEEKRTRGVDTPICDA